VTSQQHIVQLPFLGRRSYIQGTTLFGCLWDFAPPDSEFSFKAVKFIRSDKIAVNVYEEASSKPAAFDAILNWRDAGRSGIVTAAAVSPSDRPARQEFDEGAIVALANFGPDSVRLESESPGAFVPTIVALQKAFLLRTVRSSDSGQWIFTRLDMTHLPSRTAGLSIEVSTYGPGRNTCKSDLKTGGVEVGSLYFAWIEKA